MKTFLFVSRVAVALAAAAAFVFLLSEPLVEGRNAHATFFQTYFQDPFLAYAYASSLLFFAALARTWRLLGHLRAGAVPAADVAAWARFVKRCLAALAVLVAAPVAYLMIARPGDDIAGGVAMGAGLIVAFGGAALGAFLIERRFLRKAN